jgi:hypothetical protein
MILMFFSVSLLTGDSFLLPAKAFRVSMTAPQFFSFSEVIFLTECFQVMANS